MVLDKDSDQQQNQGKKKSEVKKKRKGKRRPTFFGLWATESLHHTLQDVEILQSDSRLLEWGPNCLSKKQEHGIEIFAVW